MFFELYDDDTAGWRPALLSEVAGTQKRVLRHFVGRILEFEPVVQILDLSVPQTGRALEILAVPEQVAVQTVPEAHVVVALMVFSLVDVPKISLLQYDFLEEMPSRHGSPNGHEDEDHVELYSQRVMLYRIRGRQCEVRYGQCPVAPTQLASYGSLSAGAGGNE